MKYLKYFKNLFLSLREIFIMMGIQYLLLISIILIFGTEKSIIIGTFALIILFIGYFLFKKIKVHIVNEAYFPYMLIGISIAVIFNMIIFRMGFMFQITADIPIWLNILCSGIISPIFEELLFRYNLIDNLEKFNSNKWIVILLSGIIFGIFHNNVITIIYATIVGIINSYLYVKRKNILIPVIVHISGNIFVNLLTGYNKWILIFGIILLVLSIILIKKNNSSK